MPKSTPRKHMEVWRLPHRGRCGAKRIRKFLSIQSSISPSNQNSTRSTYPASEPYIKSLPQPHSLLFPYYWSVSAPHLPTGLYSASSLLSSCPPSSATTFQWLIDWARFGCSCYWTQRVYSIYSRACIRVKYPRRKLTMRSKGKVY